MVIQPNRKQEHGVKVAHAQYGASLDAELVGKHPVEQIEFVLVRSQIVSGRDATSEIDPRGQDVSYQYGYIGSSLNPNRRQTSSAASIVDPSFTGVDELDLAPDWDTTVTPRTQRSSGQIVGIFKKIAGGPSTVSVASSVEAKTLQSYPVYSAAFGKRILGPTMGDLVDVSIEPIPNHGTTATQQDGLANEESATGIVLHRLSGLQMWTPIAVAGMGGLMAAMILILASLSSYAAGSIGYSLIFATTGGLFVILPMVIAWRIVAWVNGRSSNAYLDGGEDRGNSI